MCMCGRSGTTSHVYSELKQPRCGLPQGPVFRGSGFCYSVYLPHCKSVELIQGL